MGVHERALRRYIALGLLGYRRLPGGHYRIPEEAIVALSGESDDAGRRARRRVPTAQPSSPNAQRADSQASGPRSRRPRLGDEGAAVPYDLSPEALAALRARMREIDG